jgi:exo-beta-1,3-glucanase (GH17 family)/cellulose synthase/poly-beta-1,6-N-acetylglucosamine synthase-like glycosyltransferase
MRSVVLVIVVALATALHAVAWFLMQERVAPPNTGGQVASVSFSPIDPNRDGEVDGTTAAQIRSDLAVVAPVTRAVRTYSATNGLELVPAIASEYGLRVTLGVWLNEWEVKNDKEIENAIALAKTHRNIDSIIVGNETIFRAQALHRDDPLYSSNEAVRDLIGKIQRVKREVSIPVTTAEVPNIWLEHPELASAVDYLAVHVLPYWEGTPASAAVDHAIGVYERLRQAYPGKRIVIAEFGWPSAGLNRKDAVPSPLIQAQVVRDFVTRADAVGIDYSIVEAFDQPWKTFEGSVGPYWGMFDAARHAKFALDGAVERPNGVLNAVAAVIFGLLLSLPIPLIPRATPAQAGVLALTAHGIGAWSSNVIDYWVTHYFVFGAQIAMVVGTMLLIPLILIMKQRIEELAVILFGSKPARLLMPEMAAQEGMPPVGGPLVSIHIPACCEPPEMLRQTLDSVAKLDWPHLECIVVVNNTPDASFWRPVEEHCLQLGERFKFVHAEQLAGFKAGALRLALEHTSPDAEIIGVLDADYAVDPDWLKSLVPAFADPAVGLVQAPQDHRDGDKSILHGVMNREYAGFFDIGMVQRNEVNAIVTHGTMCLIRRSALVDAGNWSSDTIVEDTDLGLTLLKRGWRAHYTRRRFGWGLLPSDFAAYKRQRHRWAYGGVQLIKKHWRDFLPGRGHLTAKQRAAFVLGWLTWLGAESIGIVLAVLNLIWMPLVAFYGIAVPEAVLTLPVLATCAVVLLHFMVLYRMRVRAPIFVSFGAALLAMALQLTVGKAVSEGLVRDGLPFLRTTKGGTKVCLDRFPALWEGMLGGLLLLGAAVLYLTNDQYVVEISIFSAVMLVQSLPFLAALFMAAFERSPLNDLATWRKLGALSTYRPRLPRGRTPTPRPPASGGVGIVP